ncbi:MAG: glycyl-radical enzyme activating protein [Clostridia bacterium]|nr:glycyl-radical enzyme activating protein [Clostridia bacterium]
MVKTTALIFDVQRFCLFDGDGIRTTVFFKGCPMRCAWCCNPESQSFSSELMIKPAGACADCRKCLSACPQGALSLSEQGVSADPDKCVFCGRCETLCPFDRIREAGKPYTVDELTELILKDRDYYEDSRGGVTLSGGEVTAQADFVLALIERLKREKINVMIETCGFADPAVFARIAGMVDRVYFDVKLLDEAEHIRYTGQSNKPILENLRTAAKLTETVVRVPLIPGVNMTGAFAADLAALLAPLPVAAVELLPYHRLGVGKYRELGRPYALADTPLASREENLAFLEALKKQTDKPVRFR